MMPDLPLWAWLVGAFGVVLILLIVADEVRTYRRNRRFPRDL